MHGRRGAATLLVTLLALAPGCLAPTDGDAERAPADGTEEAAVPFEALRFETDRGAFVAILFPDEAPETVAFMKRLVESGYYDGREFNRVIPGFVIQEVDRLGGATDQTETVPPEFGTRAMFSAGAFGIARNEDPNSGGSEFFVMDFAHSHLYGNYTSFAQVVEGMDVVRAIARIETVSTAPASTLPLPPPLAVHDRVAVVPAKIARATVETVELPADVAARYPLVVGPSTPLETGRATLEWPRDLAAGRASDLTWYVYTRPDQEAPDLSGAQVVARAPDGTETRWTTTSDAVDGGILRAAWTPTGAGAHNLTLSTRGGALAWCDVTVAG